MGGMPSAVMGKITVLSWSGITSPGMVWRWLISTLYPRGQGMAVLRSKFDALRGMKDMLRKRREVQNSIRVDPEEINRILDHDCWSPYVLGRRAHKIQRLRRVFRSPHF